jgi:hypothetical protein
LLVIDSILAAIAGNLVQNAKWKYWHVTSARTSGSSLANVAFLSSSH